MECIRHAFVDAVRQVDSHVARGKWSTIAFDEPATPTVVANDRQCLSLEELQDPARLLKNDGFEMGMLVREKGSVSKATYKIVDIGDRVRLCETDPLGVGGEATTTVPLETLLQRWATHGGKLTVILDQPSDAMSSAAFARDVRRVRVFSVLMCLETGVGVRPNVYRTRCNPQASLLRRRFPKGHFDYILQRPLATSRTRVIRSQLGRSSLWTRLACW